jgi:DNA primase
VDNFLIQFFIAYFYPMIPNDTVQQILGAADIVDVVGEFVSLKKRGASMIACCPFHNEKTPSFYISPAKGIYKCFGCGKAGDPIKFVMELEGLSYPDALRWMAKKYGIEIKEKEYSVEEQSAQNEKESLYIALEYAQKYFMEQLLETEEGQSIGGSYFAERGFSKQEIEKFSLGYALDSKDAFHTKALKQGFSKEILEKAGLISIKDDGAVLDRFRGRVIFPIQNTAGKPIAFGARILKPNPKAPKYINSPETDIYHKSNIVYGISQAKNAIRVEETCFLVEGYTDVVSLHQAGIENVVASSGTSLTVEQIRLIRRFSDNITVLYDGDAAGIKASIRGIDLILEENMNVKSVVFPDGDDPDSYIRKVGGEAFKEYVKASQKDFIRFKTELALSEIGDDPIKKAGLIEDLVESIVKIPSPVKRTVFYQEVSRLLNIDENILITEGNKKLRAKSKDKSQQGGFPTEFVPYQHPEGTFTPISAETFDPDERLVAQEEALVKLLLLYGNKSLGQDPESGLEVLLADYLIEETSELQFKHLISNKIYLVYKEHHNKGSIPALTVFTSHEDAQIQQKVIDWLSPKHELSEKWEKYEIFVAKTENILTANPELIVTRILLETTQKEIDSLINELDIASEIDQDILLNTIEKKRNFKKTLADILGVVIS